MNIYVGNMPYDTTEEAILKAFEAYGKVASINIVTDRQTGNHRGFGFIEMPSDDEARAAIEALNGSDFGGRKLTVSESRPRPDQHKGGHRFGDDRRGGRGGGFSGGGRRGGDRGDHGE
jgi:RNA recognition motif-containing protein